ncbi:hypothetical protein [Stakelama marina]|uniref:Protein ImuA n=1 Tax=Stakelama marina TaxID=2826939 RepID=A0A8T4IBF9_9SPHN|nr:hypothetical protein [Stakelama marina]MBR0551997.1 hypothetical protein [Stakelama marina]
MGDSLSALLRQSAGIAMDSETRRTAFGAAEVDEWLGGGVRRDGVHEWYAASIEDGACAAAMALLLAERRREERQSILWLRERRGERGAGHPYGPGLVDLGLDPDSIVLLRLGDVTAMLRAAADSVRHGGAASVVLEVHGKAPALDLTASRRLALAAARSDVMVQLVRSDTEPAASVAHSRWRVASAPSVALEANAPGLPAFDLELLRHRGGREGLQCRLEWDRDKGCFQTPLSGGLSAPSVGGTDRADGRRAA